MTIKSTADDKNWRFRQCAMRIEAPFKCVPVTKDRTQARIRTTKGANSSCREILVSQVRGRIWQAVTIPEAGPGRYCWEERRKRAFSVDLEDPKLKQPCRTRLDLSINHIEPDQRSARTYQDFVWLADATVGLLNVLLNPNRYTGNWWRTQKEEIHDKQWLSYYGVDNSILYHPVLLSLYTGLLRQCLVLAGAGLAQPALHIVNRRAVAGALSTSDAERALELFKKMQPWIEVVDNPKHRATNFPVPKGSFPKLMSLHHSLYAYGFEVTFGESLVRAWQLDGALYANPLSGIHHYMGQQGQNARGVRIRALAEKSQHEDQSL